MIARWVGFALVLFLGACASVPPPSKVPNIDVIRPTAYVRPAMAAFSGRWEGNWEPNSGKSAVIVVRYVTIDYANVVVGIGDWWTEVRMRPAHPEAIPVEFQYDEEGQNSEAYRRAGLHYALRLTMPNAETLMANLKIRHEDGQWVGEMYGRLHRAQAAQ